MSAVTDDDGDERFGATLEVAVHQPIDLLAVRQRHQLRLPDHRPGGWNLS
jgi:hypothetical protein